MQRRTAIPMGTFLATLMNHCSRRAIFACLTNELTQRASRYAWTMLDPSDASARISDVYYSGRHAWRWLP